MKLLVPVDGSTASVLAVKKAIEVAGKYDASIKLISVVVPHVSIGYSRNENMWRQVDGSLITGKGPLMADDEVTNKMKANAAKLLEAIVVDLDFHNVKVETQIVTGEPYAKILDIAEDEKFDMIVMGNRGFSKIKRFFVGSVTQRVISEAKCPVLVIHSDVED